MENGAPSAVLAPEFASIQEGDSAVLERAITRELIEAFAQLSGDWNPLHVDEEFALSTEFQRPVAHGILLASFVSTLIGMQLPGPGALWAEQSFRWLVPSFAGDTVRVTVRVLHKSTGSRSLKLAVNAVNQHEVSIMTGEGTVVMPERRQARTDFPIEESLVLVTGGSGKIGRAIVRAFAEAGASVGAGYFSQGAQADQLCQEITEQGGRALPVPMDVRDLGSLEAAVLRAKAEFGRPVTALVNTAALPVRPKAFETLHWSDWQEAIDVQLRGAFQAIQTVLPGMLEAQHGYIVNIGSIYIEGVPPLHWTPYVATKAALRAMTRSLAAEYGPKGIRVNMVSPGLVADSSIGSDRLKKVQALQSPLRQLCSAEDIARLTLFLCSKAGSMITGLELPVCAGYRM